MPTKPTEQLECDAFGFVISHPTLDRKVVDLFLGSIAFATLRTLGFQQKIIHQALAFVVLGPARILGAVRLFVQNTNSTHRFTHLQTLAAGYPETHRVRRAHTFYNPGRPSTGLPRRQSIASQPTGPIAACSTEQEPTCARIANTRPCRRAILELCSGDILPCAPNSSSGVFQAWSVSFLLSDYSRDTNGVPSFSPMRL